MINLDYLDEEEREIIEAVLLRDQNERLREEERVRKLKAELNQLKKDDSMTPEDDGVCFRCRKELGFIFDSGEICPKCQSKVCKDCQVFTPTGKKWLCKYCDKQLQIKVNNPNWVGSKSNEDLTQPAIHGSELVRVALENSRANSTATSVIDENEDRKRYYEDDLSYSDEESESFGSEDYRRSPARNVTFDSPLRQSTIPSDLETVSEESEIIDEDEAEADRYYEEDQRDYSTPYPGERVPVDVHPHGKNGTYQRASPTPKRVIDTTPRLRGDEWEQMLNGKLKDASEEEEDQIMEEKSVRPMVVGVAASTGGVGVNNNEGEPSAVNSRWTENGNGDEMSERVHVSTMEVDAAPGSTVEEMGVTGGANGVAEGDTMDGDYTLVSADGSPKVKVEIIDPDDSDMVVINYSEITKDEEDDVSPSGTSEAVGAATQEKAVPGDQDVKDHEVDVEVHVLPEAIMEQRPLESHLTTDDLSTTPISQGTEEPTLLSISRETSEEPAPPGSLGDEEVSTPRSEGTEGEAASPSSQGTEDAPAPQDSHDTKDEPASTESQGFDVTNNKHTNGTHGAPYPVAVKSSTLPASADRKEPLGLDEESGVATVRRSGSAVEARIKKGDSDQAHRTSTASLYSNAEESYRLPVTGDVNFGTNYNYKTNTFEVKVLSCRDLVPVDAKRNKSNAYVKLYLLPDRTKASKRKTHVKKGTINPVFSETLKYKIMQSELETRTLCVAVWHYDRFGHNLFLGEHLLSLDTVQFDEYLARWHPLSQRQRHSTSALTYTGDVLVAIMYEPLSELEEDDQGGHYTKGRKNKAPGRMLGGTLNVQVKEAKNLVGSKLGGAPSPACKCYLLPDRSRPGKKKTTIKKSTCNPKWSDILKFENVTRDSLLERCLEVTVFDYDTVGSGSCMGGVRLGLGSNKSYGKAVTWMDSSGKEVSVWREMLKHPNHWVETFMTLRGNVGGKAKK